LISITDGKAHERTYVFTLSAAFFVVRTNFHVNSTPTTGVRSDRTVILTATARSQSIRTPCIASAISTWKTRKRFKLLTNNFTLLAVTIAQIYKSRWQVELFFKWIRQRLRIKAFYGISENAVKTHI